MSSLDTLIQKLAGAPSSVSASDTAEKAQAPIESVELIDPVYVEKLASAVDFIIDSWAGETEGATAPEAAGVPQNTKTATATEAKVESAESVTDISNLLRGKLQERLVSKKTAASEKKTQVDQDTAEAILGKLLQLKSKADIAETPDVESVDEDTETLESGFSSEEESIYGNEETSESNDEDNETEVKAASADQSLADVLKAALGTDEQSVESVSDEDAKTAGVRGSEGSTKTRKAATQVLKTKLMAKVSEEAQL